MDMKRLTAALAVLCATTAHAQTPCTSRIGRPAICVHNPVTAPAEVLPNWGTTPGEVDAYFPATILHNFQTNPNINTVIATMTPIELARLSTLMIANDPWWRSTYELLIVSAERLSAPNLKKLASVFGETELSWVVPYMPAAVRAQYLALPAQRPVVASYSYVAAGGAWRATTIVAAYPFEVYLEYLTSASGSRQVLTAQTARYLQQRLKAPDGLTIVGWLGVLYNVATYIDPGLPGQLDDASDWLEWNNRYATWTELPPPIPNNTITNEIAPTLIVVQPPDPGNVPGLPNIAPPTLTDLLNQIMAECAQDIPC